MESKSETSKELLNINGSRKDPFLITREKPFRLPTSSALSRVKAFLPEMQQANHSLLASSSSAAIDIENIDGEGPFIEMNLALYERDSDSHSEAEMNLDLKSSNSEDDNSEEDDVINLGSKVTEDNIKFPKSQKCKKPNIQILSDTAEERTEKIENRTMSSDLGKQLDRTDQMKDEITLENANDNVLLSEQVGKENKKKSSRTVGQKKSKLQQTSSRKAGRRKGRKR